MNPPPIPAVTETRTYREWYLDGANDPFDGQYGRIMSEYTIQAAISPVEIRNKVYASATTIPHAYVYLCRDDPTDPTDHGRSILLHRVAKYPVYMGHALTQWNDIPFAFYGDVINQQITTVTFPGNTFHQVGQAHRVPSNQLMDIIVNQDLTVQLLGPFNNANAGTELVQARNVMYVPFRYVNLLLTAPLTPQEM